MISDKEFIDYLKETAERFLPANVQCKTVQDVFNTASHHAATHFARGCLKKLGIEFAAPTIDDAASVDRTNGTDIQKHANHVACPRCHGTGHVDKSESMWS